MWENREICQHDPLNNAKCTNHLGSLSEGFGRTVQFTYKISLVLYQVFLILLLKYQFRFYFTPAYSEGGRIKQSKGGLS